jgi:uncharacterized protein YkwD
MYGLGAESVTPLGKRPPPLFRGVRTTRADQRRELCTGATPQGVPGAAILTHKPRSNFRSFYVPNQTTPTPQFRCWRGPARALLAGCALFLAGLASAATETPDDRLKPHCRGMPSPEEVLRRLNAERARGALCRSDGAYPAAAPLRWNDTLAAAAVAQSDDMASVSRMTHYDTRNRGLAERLVAVGYRFSAAVENVAFGYNSLDAVVVAWLASEGHCVNMMNPKVLELGLACSDGTTPGQDRYWTLVLGAPPAAR